MKVTTWTEEMEVTQVTCSEIEAHKVKAEREQEGWFLRSSRRELVGQTEHGGSYDDITLVNVLTFIRAKQY